MAPLGYPGYSRLNMLNMSIERYLNEQQLLGNRITLNNAELQELLTYIVANVPEDEDAFPQNEDGYSLYEMDVSMPITTDCHMPMKVGVGLCAGGEPVLPAQGGSHPLSGILRAERLR